MALLASFIENHDLFLSVGAGAVLFLLLASLQVRLVHSVLFGLALAIVVFFSISELLPMVLSNPPV